MLSGMVRYEVVPDFHYEGIASIRTYKSEKRANRVVARWNRKHPKHPYQVRERVTK